MMLNENPDPVNQTDTIDRFIRRYTMVLVGLVLLTTVSFGSMMLILSFNVADPAEVNISGRQRTLLQRIALQVSVLSHTMPEEQRLIHQSILQESITLMEFSHRALLEGNDEIGTSGNLSEELHQHYENPPADLSARVELFLGRAEEALQASRTAQLIDPMLSVEVVAMSDSLLPLLDRAVTLYQDKAARHIENIQTLLGALYILTVSALVALWGVVFRPFVELMRRDEAQLAEVQQIQHEEHQQQAFSREFNTALEMIDDEKGLVGLMTRAMTHLGGDTPLELKLSDSSQAHLRTVAAHPVSGPAGCTVETPWQCAAVRRGRAVTFNSSEALDACPRLRGRKEGGCSGVCVPVTFMGRAIGVLHSVGEHGASADPKYLERLEMMATSAGARLSSLRNLEQFQLQATTDPLTGLLNRRALETQVRPLVDQQTPFAVAMMDLDHFKRLNDTHGHDAGDRALATFSKVVREVVRKGDLVARFGGEEFVVVFPQCTAEQACRTLERVREHLARVTAGNDTPTFTASYGLSDTRCGFDLQALIQIADAALLRAKDQGRDQVLVADMGEPDAEPPRMFDIEEVA